MIRNDLDEGNFAYGVFTYRKSLALSIMISFFPNYTIMASEEELLIGSKAISVSELSIEPSIMQDLNFKILNMAYHKSPS